MPAPDTIQHIVESGDAQLYGALYSMNFERIEGKTSPTILTHVRAGKQTVIEEVQQAGFVLASETDLLEQNHCLRFRRP